MRIQQFCTALFLVAAAACADARPPERCLTIKYGFCATGTAAECERAKRAFETGDAVKCASELVWMNSERRSAAIALRAEMKKGQVDLASKLATMTCRASEAGSLQYSSILQQLHQLAESAVAPAEAEVKDPKDWPLPAP